jgi:hypothetical protein
MVMLAATLTERHSTDALPGLTVIHQTGRSRPLKFSEHGDVQ